MLRSNIPDQLMSDALPVLEEVIMSSHEKYPDKIPMLFNTLPSSSWGEQSVSAAGIKAAVEKPEGEPAAFDEPIEGYDKTWTHLTYAIYTSFSKELVKDDRLNWVGKTLKSLGKAMYQTCQVVSFNILNNGFTDTGPDGSSLFNTSHTMVGLHTYANRPSTDIAFSVAGMREMEVDMMRQPDHRNINSLVEPEIIWGPPEISQDVDEILNSPDRSDTANRAKNTLYNRYQAVISPFLTSTSAWGAATSPDEHELRFYLREAASVRSWIDNPTGNPCHAIEKRFSVGYGDFVGLWGTSP